MTKLIGITGGIGAGKTTVCKIFSTLGIPIFNADEAAKKLVEIDDDIKIKIIQLLGKEAYIKNKYNRKYVASVVYNNIELLKKLNGIIHPKVRESALAWLRNQKIASFYLYEAALINTSGEGNIFTKIIVVTAPLNQRINRIKIRDGRSETEILAIINKQISDEERLSFADYVIENNEKSSIIRQVLEVHHHLKQYVRK